MKYLEIFEKYNQKVYSRALMSYCNNKASLNQIRKAIFDGADVNYRDVCDNTPLHKATNIKFASAIELLIKNGANVNVQNDLGYTPLMNVIASGSWMFSKDTRGKKSISLLIDAGADLNYRNYRGLDMFDLSGQEVKLFIKEKYPEKYEEYIVKKDAEKYNL
jgi:ankyrin repeat protein